MEQPTLGYEDFCQILGRVSLEAYLRFETFSANCHRQLDALKSQIAQLTQANSQLETVNGEQAKTIEILQANVDMARRERDV